MISYDVTDSRDNQVFQKVVQTVIKNGHTLNRGLITSPNETDKLNNLIIY